VTLENPSWTAVADVASLMPETVRRVEVEGMSVALVCTRASVYALEDLCAHDGGFLSEGRVDGIVLTCPNHGWAYEAPTGRCMTDDCAQRRRFDTKLERGRVWVRPERL
jgi:nitrite reductase/ring-hydroxylating ferredoxin subunit